MNGSRRHVCIEATAASIYFLTEIYTVARRSGQYALPRIEENWPHKIAFPFVKVNLIRIIDQNQCPYFLREAVDDSPQDPGSPISSDP